jgi:DNA-binding FadR family transcriptional regulator
VARYVGKFGAYVAGEPSRVLVPGRSARAHTQRSLGGMSGADLVRSRIALEVRLGELSPGDRLTDAGVISVALGVSEVRVRRALETMGQDGLLERRRGRAGGTFIAERWDAAASSMRHDEQAAQLVDFQMVLESGLAALGAGEVELDDLVALGEHIQSAEAGLEPDSYAIADARFHLALATVLGGWQARERQMDLLGKLCLALPQPPVDVARQQDRAHARLLDALERGSIDVAVQAVKLHARCWPPRADADSRALL